jgi:hypothetical protein
MAVDRKEEDACASAVRKFGDPASDPGCNSAVLGCTDREATQNDAHRGASSDPGDGRLVTQARIGPLCGAKPLGGLAERQRRPGAEPFRRCSVFCEGRTVIREASAGQQYCTLNRETFGIGQLCGAGLLPRREAFARLREAALAMPSIDARRSWVRADVERKVMASFRDGLARPRQPAVRGARAYG